MPHMIIDHSANVADKVDMDGFCAAVHAAMLETGLFEIGGIRVRALRADHFVVADADPANGYVHMTLRIGVGRSVEDRKRAGDAIFKAASEHLAPLLSEPHFALSFVIEELDAELSWKKNSIHARLRGA